MKKEECPKWEDMRITSRKFVDAGGNVVTKACFACKNALDCNAMDLEECKWKMKDDVVCCPGLKEE